MNGVPGMLIDLLRAEWDFFAVLIVTAAVVVTIRAIGRELDRSS